MRSDLERTRAHADALGRLHHREPLDVQQLHRLALIRREHRERPLELGRECVLSRQGDLIRGIRHVL
jgi:hypothetical protein